jgi:putative flippase GtrA
LAQIIELELPSEPLHGELHLREQVSSIPTQPLKMYKKSWRSLFWQLFRFGLVGGLNSGIDLLIFNGLLWLGPTQNTTSLLAYNSFAYAFGAINSFILNKYWTFQNKQRTTYGEVLRFALTTFCGIVCNDGILWIAGSFLHPVMINATLWANASKVLAISGTFMISYLGMRLWVFTHQPGEDARMNNVSSQKEARTPISHKKS